MSPLSCIFNIVRPLHIIFPCLLLVYASIFSPCQAMLSAQGDQCRPTLPSSVGHGWNMENRQHTPVLCELPCAPESILKLINCSCVKNRWSAPCKCRASKLSCTKMCSCSGDKTLCDNIYPCEGDEADISDTEDNEADDLEWRQC